MRLLVANFDAEIEMARAATPGPHPRLPAHVRKRLASARAELSVLAPEAAIVSAADEVEGNATEILAWAETDSIAALRAASKNHLPEFVLNDRSWIDALWHLRSDASATRACHDRRFWLALADARGTLLPETHVVSSLAELRDRLPKVIEKSHEGAWIAKAPLSASGRERVYRWELDFPGDIETRLERLFARYEQLILEPLMTRTMDVGVCGIIDESGAHLFDPHRLDVDGAGVFRGIDLGSPALPDEAQRAIREAAEAAGDALYQRGHRGAFGIDAFIYRTPSGAITCHPMGEINARLTFGHLAHAKRVQAQVSTRRDR